MSAHRYTDTIYHYNDRRKETALSIKDRVEERMQALGIKSAAAAARRAEVPYASMYSLLKDPKYNPTHETLEKIATGFGVSVDWLVREEGEPAVLELASPPEVVEIERLLTDALAAVQELRVRYASTSAPSGMDPREVVDWLRRLDARARAALVREAEGLPPQEEAG